MAGYPPEAPMPPPLPSFGHNRPPPGAIRVDDWSPAAMPVHDDFPMVEVYDDDRLHKPKKEGKDKKSNGPVEVQLKGYMLEPAEPLLGEKASWARVGKRALPFDEAKLQNITKKHRERTRTGPAGDFSNLSSKQQGIIDRLIAEHKSKETNKNADWILHDVQRFGTWHWRTLEIKKIQVILRRQDVNATKPGDRSTGNSSSYGFGEIIDLSYPLPTKKEKGEKGEKGEKNKRGNSNSRHDDLQPIDDPLGPGLPALDDHHAYPSHQEPMYQPPYQPPPPPIGPPQGFREHRDPLQQYAPAGGMPPYPQQQQPPPPLPYPQDHPFMPEAQVQPYQFDTPLERHVSARRQTRSPSPRRRRRSQSTRRIAKLENDIQNLNDKIENWNIGSESSEGQYEGDSIFSPPPSGGSFTPPSTPPMSRRGSIHVPKDRRNDRRYRNERKYRDELAEIRPAITSRPRRDSGRYSPERVPREVRYREASRYEARSPRLERRQTYDDYPIGRVAEPRYLPPAPAPVQRRLTDFPEAYGIANYDEQLRRDRKGGRPSMAYEPVFEDRYEGGRREGGRRERAFDEDSYVPSRRRNVVGGRDGYYM